MWNELPADIRRATSLETFLFFMQLYLQFQHLHYLHYCDTNIYAYNILANYTYTTYTCTTLQYDTKKTT